MNTSLSADAPTISPAAAASSSASPPPATVSSSVSPPPTAASSSVSPPPAAASSSKGATLVALVSASVSAPVPAQRRKSLRNPNINYRAGWWSVTIQVAKNKSIFGAIFGEQVVLNMLGRAVESYWRGLPAMYPELELFDFVVMPNHFHALLRIRWKPENHEHHLGFLMSRFKGGTSFIYGKMKRAGEIEDIGDQLWQRDYWDDLITDNEEFAGWQKYIRENPLNWSRDRYGVCTSFLFGNTELLNTPRIAFVASQGFFANDLRPQRISPERIVSPEPAPVVISTFTSAQEREALQRALIKGKRIIQIIPQGIPPIEELQPILLAACRDGRALLLSPQPPHSRLNKKIATWCNEYVLRHADEIWVGDISPSGMLASILYSLGYDVRHE